MVLHVTLIRRRSFIPRCAGLSYVALEVRGGPGDRRWREGFAGSGMDQSNSTRGGCCCTLSPALPAVDAELRQTFFPPHLLTPLPWTPPTSQVLLRGLSAPLAAPPGALVAVARVVTNVQEYKHRMEKHPTSCPGISPITITFPDPPAAAFSIAPVANHGCPQMSRPAGPPEQPTWDTSFLFQGRDVATLFSEDTALVIEYYPYKTMWDVPGTLIPVGYSVLPLTSRVFRELAARSGEMRVDGLAMQGTDLKTTSGAIPTVGLCLQLLQSERPAAFLTPSGSDALPSPGPADASTFKRGEELRAAPVCPFSCQLHRDNVSLPAADAVASILPGKQLFPHGTGAPSEEQRSQEITGDKQELVSAEETGGAGGTGGDSGVPRAGPGSRGDRSSTLPEASSYRLALKRMAGDLLSLRQHVTSLEVENRHLRRSLASREELGHTLLADVDLDVMTREELLDRLATLKHKLVAGTVEMRRLKDRVQRLQNELIRKNDQEKDLVLLQRAHQQQQAVLKRCQEKVAKTKNLEETVRQQEKVKPSPGRCMPCCWPRTAGCGRTWRDPPTSCPPSSRSPQPCRVVLGVRRSCLCWPGWRRHKPRGGCWKGSWRRRRGSGDGRSRSSALGCWSGSTASPTPPPRICRQSPQPP
ncbi:coiled-coil domain-containing protein 33 isoform X2 [Haliaeetus albicilla]|uniref:coiled-coil domain-containing protein 33 isoform X2 n=1 Tax=Haliaeetus albicilla TaxID=8969 RepID=UPI0037E9ACDF